MEDSSLLRVGAISAIAGAVVLFVATLLHPTDADPNDAVAAFREYAADSLWIASHLGQFLGIALIVAGLLALYLNLLSGGGAAWARLGMVGAVASLTLVAVLQAVDGIALKAMVDAWVAAPPEREMAAFQAAFGVRQIEVGLASMVSLVFGITVILYGIAILRSDLYPGWLGWLGVAGGLATGASGVVMAYAGFSGLAMGISMTASSVLVLWVLTMGVLMWRYGPQNQSRQSQNGA